MSRVCVMCGRDKMKGNQVSHSNVKTIKHYNVNLQKKPVEIDGKKTKAYVCTKCLRTLEKNEQDA